MALPKKKPQNYQQLYSEHDKQIVEALRKRLNDRIQNDPVVCKKAAMILESWLNPKKK